MEIMDGLLQIFNVDHGACALITMPGLQTNTAQRILIDCGHATDYKGQRWTPGQHLRSQGITYIDLLVCTNYDEDHASGIPSLVEQGINVGCILGNPTVPPNVIEHLKTEDGMGNGIRTLMNTLALRANQGDAQIPPNIPGVSLSYFWNPWPHWDTENNLSLVAHLNIRGINFLFPGDMEKDGFNNLLKLQSFASLMSGINVLVAAHHGRENGKCESMFDNYGCNPNLIVISDCAKKFQSQETVPYYRSKAIGIEGFRGQTTRHVLTTRTDGEIKFRFEGRRCIAY